MQQPLMRAPLMADSICGAAGQAHGCGTRCRYPGESPSPRLTPAAHAYIRLSHSSPSPTTHSHVRVRASPTRSCCCKRGCHGSRPFLLTLEYCIGGTLTLLPTCRERQRQRDTHTPLPRPWIAIARPPGKLKKEKKSDSRGRWEGRWRWGPA